MHRTGIGEQLLFMCGIHGFTLWKKICVRQKTRQPRPPCEQTCTQSHEKHAFLAVQANELTYMSLYIIYLYLVKNKLHNSTNWENCFFKLKMTLKWKATFHSDGANSCFCVGGTFSTRIKEWGSRGWEIQKQPPPLFQGLLHSTPSARKRWGGETRRGEEEKKKIIQEMFIFFFFRKQFYVT